MDNDRKGNDRPRNPIDHWETVEMLHSDLQNVGKDALGLVIEVQRPVFEGGRTGHVAMGVVLKRGERMLRLKCHGGETTEISALREMLNRLDDAKLDETKDRFAELRKEHDPPPRPQRQERGSGPSRVGGGAGGLGQFSAPGKTARKRENKAKRARGETV